IRSAAWHKRPELAIAIDGSEPSCSDVNLTGPCNFRPSNAGAAERLDYRLDHDIIHHLAVAEALRDQPDHQTPVFAPLKREGDQARGEVYGGEQDPEERHTMKVALDRRVAMLVD